MALNNSASNTKEYDFTPKFLFVRAKKSNKKNVKRLSNVYPMLLSCFPSYLQYGKLSNFRIKELPQQNTHRLLQVVPELFLTIGKDKTIYIERDSNINIHKIDSNVFLFNTTHYNIKKQHKQPTTRYIN